MPFCQYVNEPMFMVFEAVKCNDNPAVLSVLAEMGTGFDCASKVIIHFLTRTKPLDLPLYLCGFVMMKLFITAYVISQLQLVTSSVIRTLNKHKYL